MIPLREQEYIRQRFEQELEGKVKIEYFTQAASAIYVPGREECTYCEETGKMLEELAGLSDKISLTVYLFADAPEEAKKAGIDKVPGIVMRGPANRPIRYYGIPGGNEFPNFIEAIVEVSRQKTEVSPDAAKHLKKLKEKTSIDVYVTPTCPHCPGVIRAAYRLALASAKIEATAVEIGEFPRLAQQLGVQAVPMTVINGRIAISGAMDEATLAEHALKAARGEAVDKQATQSGATTAMAPPGGQAPGGQAPGGQTPGSGLILPR